MAGRWKTGVRRYGFTLIELMIVIGIVLLLVGILLPALNAARSSAQASTCGLHLKTFGQAFEIYAADSKKSYRTSGAFNYLLDGPVDEVGWVHDVIASKVGTPGQMMCPTNNFRISETVGDYTGGRDYTAISGLDVNPLVWGTAPSAVGPAPPPTPIESVGFESQEFWTKGYNTNFVATWQLVRGDPTGTDPGASEYSRNRDTRNPPDSPSDGNGPLSQDIHLSIGDVAPNQVALLGDARQQLQAGRTLSDVQAVNDFAGETLAQADGILTETTTTGMRVQMDQADSSFGSDRRGHFFGEILPVHNAREINGEGGSANILFGDGHVARHADTTGANSQADGFLGAFINTAGDVEINGPAFEDELLGEIWWKRLDE